MSRIKGGNTKPELLVRSFLHKKGLRFRLHDWRLPGKPDIVLPRYKTAIFVHGCFWHRHKGCKDASVPKSRAGFWNKKFKDNVRRFQEVEGLLKKAGWRVIVIWECDIFKDKQPKLEKVLKSIKCRK